jgi:hypothetical protein
MPEERRRVLPDPISLLSVDVEPVPAWLANFKAGDLLPFEEFLKSRVVYYPACANVWKDVQIFGHVHAAHCFVRADFGLSLDEVKRQVVGGERDNVFKDYHVVSSHAAEKRDYNQHKIGNLGQQATVRAVEDFRAVDHILGIICNMGEWPLTPHIHVDYPDLWHNRHYREPERGAFVYWAVLEREEEASSRKIPARIAIMHLGLDAFVGFDALFCQKGNEFGYAKHGRRFPYAVILDGTCYDGWALGGIAPGPAGGRECDFSEFLQRNNFRKRPKWLLIADNVPPWPQYSQKSGCDDTGRKLFLRRGQKMGSGSVMFEKERLSYEE